MKTFRAVNVPLRLGQSFAPGVGLLVALFFLSAAALQGAPRESSSNPLPDEARAVVSLKAAVGGPLVRGDWALRCLIVTGYGRERVSLPVELIGGWTEKTGRWQRLRLPNGTQFLIKDAELTSANNSTPAGFSRLHSMGSRGAEGSMSLRPITPKQKAAPPAPGVIVAVPEAPDVPLPSAFPLPEAAPAVAVVTPEPSHPYSAVFQLAEKSPARALTTDERRGFIHSRLPLSWDLYTFDFLNFPVIKYKGVEKSHARWCDTMELTDPAPSSSFVRALLWLDVEFGAPLESELYDAQNRLLKTVRAVSIQKVELPAGDNIGDGFQKTNSSLTADSRRGATVQNQPEVSTPGDKQAQDEWILKRWEVVDATTHEKVSVEVQAVALNQSWNPSLYSEISTIADWPVLPEASWVVLP